MATQIAPTPIVKGKAAEAIIKEMQQKSTPAAMRGAEILTMKFKGMVKMNATIYTLDL